jgi:methylmalonyl-CoA mutase
MIELVNQQHQLKWNTIAKPLAYNTSQVSTPTIPLNRFNYLNEIVETIQKNRVWISEQKQLASQWYSYEQVMQNPKLKKLPLLKEEADKVAGAIDPEVKKSIQTWEATKTTYQQEALVYEIRGKKIHQPLRFKTESGLSLQKVYLPNFKDWGDIAEWQLKENVPGHYPYTAGVFDLKRTGEDPTRMFAGEGGPEKTNQRFHFLASGQPATRLSTAFDSVTLYGQDPSNRMDVFGKIGNAGVNIASVDDIKKLYSGINLNDPTSSVSMTINGPAAIILAMFFNAAIDQACEQYITEQKMWPAVNKKLNQIFKTKPRPVYHDFEGLKKQSIHHNGLGLKLLGVGGDQVLDPKVYDTIKKQVLQNVRGTLQADILKEDQAQNTCIFSIDFALKLMGDVQSYFVDQKVKNFYSISISGYHIAEAGANPITQLAFTLANGFTYIEYFLNRGLAIDDFIPNFSFFFSNGMDPEYAVIGRVARRIWAQSMKLKYKANPRSQKLKYHIQTSGRSLHAQEIDFNDIRTTLQALYAIYDQCNSLHTNAYDEAITTPTKESVRRALAIQLIINKELGTAKVENAQQGSFLMNELTDLVEEAVLQELERINARGGVLGAMERMYQRSKIQEESMLYETRKHHGEIPIIGVNTFIDEADQNSNDRRPVFRSSASEKKLQIANLAQFKNRNKDQAAAYLNLLHQAAVQNENVFDLLMEAVKYCSLGDITNLLYHTGGKYSRNL